MPRRPEHAWIGEIWVDVTVREAHSYSADVTEHPVERGSDVADHMRPRQRSITIEGIISNTPLEMPGSHAFTEIDRSPISIAGDPVPSGAPHTYSIEGEPDVGLVGIVPGVDQGVALLGVVGLDVTNAKQFAAVGTPHAQSSAQEMSASALHFTQDFDRVGAVHDALLSIVRESRLIEVITMLTVYENVALTDVQIERDERTGNALRFSASGRELRIVDSDTVDVPDPVDVRARKPKSLGKQQTTEAAPAEVAQVEALRSHLAGALGLP